MIGEKELLKLMADLESDRVERTISTTDTTKIREAICAFSNDFPNHRQPGYLLIGVGDKTGKACGLRATDELLRNLAGLRQDGEILPLPAMTVAKLPLTDGSGDVVVLQFVSTASRTISKSRIPAASMGRPHPRISRAKPITGTRFSPRR